MDAITQPRCRQPGLHLRQISGPHLRGRVLDLGCGGGRLAQWVEPASYLGFDIDPASLAGCNEPSAPGRTALTLTGKVGEGGLTRLAVSGTLSGATLAPGVTADLTVNLFLNVDLSGRG